MQMTSAHAPAFAISDAIQSHMHQVEQLGKVIGSAGFAVLLVTANRRIMCANDAAEKLLAENNLLRRERDCLNLKDPGAARKLNVLLSPGLRRTGDAAPKGSLVHRDKYGNASLVIHVVPLVQQADVRNLDREAAIAGLFIVDCQRCTADRIDAFADLFELTRAEARVLAQLVSGDGLKISANRLNIAQSTARTHLSHILEKTGAHRQAELIRVFFETTIPWEGYRSATALKLMPLQRAGPSRRNQEDSKQPKEIRPHSTPAAVML
jgi:DNA-binding CsgD family transcriptional regulator